MTVTHEETPFILSLHLFVRSVAHGLISVFASTYHCGETFSKMKYVTIIHFLPVGGGLWGAQPIMQGSSVYWLNTVLFKLFHLWKPLSDKHFPEPHPFVRIAI
jgi:hypothetical protein